MKRGINHYIELLMVMTEKELRARYKYTVFGFLWLIINPLLQMLVIGFIFSFFMKSPMEYYYFYLFTGLLIWNFFSLSLTKATPSIVFERSLIKKAMFPRMVIPIAIIASNLLHLFIAMILLMIPLIFVHPISFMNIIFLGIGFILLLMFTIGLSLLTSALNVRFRDVTFFVQALLIVWFYATPIVYSFMVVPKEYHWLWIFNPMTSIVQFFQYALMHYPLPTLSICVGNIFIIISITIMGSIIFQKESKNFDDWI